MAKEIYIAKDGTREVYEYANITARERQPRALSKAKQRAKASVILDWAAREIIGKKKYSNSAFRGKVAEFSKGSFTENLSYGRLFEAKADVLMHLDDYLKPYLAFWYETPVHGNHNGFYKTKVKYKGELQEFKGRDMELHFAEHSDGKLYFHFIKFI